MLGLEGGAPARHRGKKIPVALQVSRELFQSIAARRELAYGRREAETLRTGVRRNDDAVAKFERPVMSLK
jgi:hypothetical protein